MAKKQIPAWQLMGLDGPPPVVNGMHDYGTVWTPDTPRPSWWANVRSDLYWGVWSLDYWGKKVRRDIEHGRKQDGPGTLRTRALERLALTLVALVAQTYRVARKGEPQTQR
ncbi:hypothetical protein [Longimicrobium sp.]|jgi:hypothetical protein|uniref:hypothetical protein n=1 Tax=Longimicrobium sp. TaxID=2029185 RepID=UPI002ED86451